MDRIFVAEKKLKKSEIEKEWEIVIKQEISLTEYETIMSKFSVTGPCHQVTEAKDIVLSNAESLIGWLNQDNLNRKFREGMPYKKILMNSNRLLFNFSASIYSFIEITRKIIKKRDIEWAEKYNELDRVMYDDYMEYRFWKMMRNYIVHCEFPYQSFSYSDDDTCQVMCKRDTLLKHSGWKHVKKDIEQMPDIIDIAKLAGTMCSHIAVMYYYFYETVADSIIECIEAYNTFKTDYQVNSPIFVKEKKEEKLVLDPIPIHELYEYYEVLKEHPNIDIAEIY